MCICVLKTDVPAVSTRKLQTYLLCSPAPNITWVAIGGEIPADRGVISNHGTRLVISGTEPGDPNGYACAAENPAGTIEDVLRFEIQGQCENIPVQQVSIEIQ